MTGDCTGCECRRAEARPTSRSLSARNVLNVGRASARPALAVPARRRPHGRLSAQISLRVPAG
ncbi:MAG TPA: hypothetical protein VEO54_01660 [Thermoanaerobaculia bacterium]|nr:hypothetical protein [Thermoanaerobaculia bacterium]